MTGGNGRIWPLSVRDLIAVQQRLGPAKPGSDEGGAAGEHGGMALPRHDAVNGRTCRRATVAYGLLMLQKQYSSMPPEPSPGGRKCSLSTMWLWPPTKDR